MTNFAPVDRISKRIQFVAATVTGIDLARKVVQVSGGSAESKPVPEEYRADRIVIALGSITDFRGIPGVAETAIPMKNCGTRPNSIDAFLRVWKKLHGKRILSGEKHC
jgi:NADH dehydrogenase FAD-containing subunit